MNITERVEFYYKKGWSDLNCNPPFDNPRNLLGSTHDPAIEIQLNMVYMKGWNDQKKGIDYARLTI